MPKDFKEKKEIFFSSLKEISFASSKDMEKEISLLPTNEEERKTKEKKEISCLSLKEISFMSSKDTEKEISFLFSLTTDFKETKETPADVN